MTYEDFVRYDTDKCKSVIEKSHNLLEIGKEKRNEIHRKELIECGIL